MGDIHRYCPNNSPRDSPTCFGCGDVGHIQRYCPRKRKWHKAKRAESEESRQGNLTSVVKMSMLQRSWRLLETLSLRIKNAIHG